MRSAGDQSRVFVRAPRQPGIALARTITRPISMIVPSPPAAPPTTLARYLAEQLARSLPAGRDRECRRRRRQH